MTTSTTSSTDLYPSRVASEPRLTERHDPVIHGEPAGALTRYQRDSFESNGFLTFGDFFTPQEIDELQREARRLRHGHWLVDRDDVVNEPESGDVRSIFRIHETSDVFDRVARHPRILDKVQEILGDTVYLHQSRINYKPGLRGKEFFWHSDFETWHVEDGMPRMRAVSCSIALSPNYPYNGPLMLVPGSHRYFLSCVGETPEENYKNSLQKQEFGVPDGEELGKLVELGGGIVAPTGPAGAITMFECNTMHGSSSNITPYSRTNLFLVYNSVDNRLQEPFSGQDPRPEYLAHRDEVTPLRPAT